MKIKARTGIIIWITAVALLAGTVAIAAMYNEFDGIGSYLTILLIMMAATAATVSFVLRNYIIVTEQMIKVCFGMTTTVLETSSVMSLKKVTNLMASASTSAKRIEVRYAGGIIYVSPKDEEVFIRAICSYNAKVKVC